MVRSRCSRSGPGWLGPGHAGLLHRPVRTPRLLVVSEAGANRLPACLATLARPRSHGALVVGAA